MALTKGLSEQCEYPKPFKLGLEGKGLLVTHVVCVPILGPVLGPVLNLVREPSIPVLDLDTCAVQKLLFISPCACHGRTCDTGCAWHSKELPWPGAHHLPA